MTFVFIPPQTQLRCVQNKGQKNTSGFATPICFIFLSLFLEFVLSILRLQKVVFNSPSLVAIAAASTAVVVYRSNGNVRWRTNNTGKANVVKTQILRFAFVGTLAAWGGFIFLLQSGVGYLI